MKICRTCKQEKVEDEFFLYRKHIGGKQYMRPDCKPCWTELRRPYLKKYHADNAEILKERYRGRYKKNKALMNAAGKRHYKKLQQIVFNHYGNQCACCGEAERSFLALDHVNNDGAQHRRELGAGHVLFRWIIENNFPDTIQLLCHNCNMGKHRNGGVCPHVSNRMNYTKPSEVYLPSNWIC